MTNCKDQCGAAAVRPYAVRFESVSPDVLAFPTGERRVAEPEYRERLIPFNSGINARRESSDDAERSFEPVVINFERACENMAWSRRAPIAAGACSALDAFRSDSRPARLRIYCGE